MSVGRSRTTAGQTGYVLAVNASCTLQWLPDTPPGFQAPAPSPIAVANPLIHYSLLVPPSSSIIELMQTADDFNNNADRRSCQHVRVGQMG